jgi:hypothetical protein
MVIPNLRWNHKHVTYRVILRLIPSPNRCSFLSLFHHAYRVAGNCKLTHLSISLLQVNNALMELIKATKSMMKPEEWSSQPENSSETGALISARPVSVTIRTDDGGNAAIAVYNLLAKLQLSFLYVIGVILMGFEHMRNIVKVMKPVRVAAIES